MEEWRRNYEYEKIEVSSEGNVRSSLRTPRILKPALSRDGYLSVSVKNAETGKFDKKRVDRLVLETFEPINQAVRGDFIAYHLDSSEEGILNNSLDNLEWRFKNGSV